MPGGRSSNKHLDKPARQLLFSEALRQTRTPSPASQEHRTNQSRIMGDTSQGATMNSILQEISAVGRSIEGMDSMMTFLTEDTKSMRLDITGFQSQLTALEQRVTTVETQAVLASDRDQELLYLRSKFIDLEDKSSRDNAHFLGFPEDIEGADVQSFLKNTLPQLTGLTFDPPLEFQRAHRLGPKRRNGPTTHDLSFPASCDIRRLDSFLQKARTQGPFRMNDLQIRMTADFSKKTSERRKAFLALRPHLQQLEIKFGLFEPARMWITKNNVSKYFYNPMDLSLYLDCVSDCPMDTASRSQPQALITMALNSLPKESALERPDDDPSETLNRGRDLERLSKNHNNRGQVLHAVAKYTQVTDRDKSCFPLKPSPAPT
ncbi:hypothetical protein NDU88_003633 [Pleurodeles waltl]|uniref:Uncharacterized protein n=1 Tax=Pleurodeles waltl TaxID=8319 RepID=A0AAV7LFV7_PLEWA|nr:hypothetical protein NDU88_003633 [Pleurodeles waltl]